MSRPEPFGNFKWVDDPGEIDIVQIPKSGDVGYF